MPLDPFTILAVGAVVCAAFLVAGITGMGAVVLALPLTSLFIGVRLSVCSLQTLGLFLSAYIVATGWRHVRRKQFIVTVALGVVGMPIGILFADRLPESALMIVIGLYVVVMGARELLPGLRDRRLPSWLLKAQLVAGGAVHGAFASGGPLMISYFHEEIHDKTAFRATMSLSFVVLALLLLAQWTVSGSWAEGTLPATALMLPFMLAGVAAGEWIHRRVNIRVFRTLVSVVMVVIGVLTIAPRLPLG